MHASKWKPDVFSVQPLGYYCSIGDLQERVSYGELSRNFRDAFKHMHILETGPAVKQRRQKKKSRGENSAIGELRFYMPL